MLKSYTVLENLDDIVDFECILTLNIF